MKVGIAVGARPLSGGRLLSASMCFMSATSTKGTEAAGSPVSRAMAMAGCSKLLSSVRSSTSNSKRTWSHSQAFCGSLKGKLYVMVLFGAGVKSCTTCSSSFVFTSRSTARVGIESRPISSQSPPGQMDFESMYVTDKTPWVSHCPNAFKLCFCFSTQEQMFSMRNAMRPVAQITQPKRCQARGTLGRICSAM